MLAPIIEFSCIIPLLRAGNLCVLYLNIRNYQKIYVNIIIAYNFIYTDSIIPRIKQLKIFTFYMLR